eukprot:12482-Heterococcus_DN1.PRE.3
MHGSSAGSSLRKQAQDLSTVTSALITPSAQATNKLNSTQLHLKLKSTESRTAWHHAGVENLHAPCRKGARAGSQLPACTSDLATQRAA